MSCSLSYHSGVLVGKSDLEIQENEIFHKIADVSKKLLMSAKFLHKKSDLHLMHINSGKFQPII